MRPNSRGAGARRLPLLIGLLLAAEAGCSRPPAAWQSVLNATEPGGGRTAVAYQRHARGPTIGFDFRVMLYPDSARALAERQGTNVWESFDVPAIALRWGAQDSLIVTAEESERTARYARSL